jgi:hypothetical protein
VNHPITHTKWKEHKSLSMQFAGSFLSDNVNAMRPTIDLKYFHPEPRNRKS